MSFFFSCVFYYPVPWGVKSIFVASIWCYIHVIAEEQGLDVSWDLTVYSLTLNFVLTLVSLVGKVLKLSALKTCRVPAELLFTYSFHLGPHCAFWTCFVASGNNCRLFCTLERDTHRVSETFIEECFVWGSWSFGYVVSVRTSGVSPKPLLSIKEEAEREEGEKMLYKQTNCSLTTA